MPGEQGICRNLLGLAALAATLAACEGVTVVTDEDPLVPEDETPATPVTPLVLTSISPSTGTTSGGTTLTLTGTGFGPSLTALAGGVSCGSVSYVSSTQATCITSSHAAGLVDVRVAVGGAQSTKTGAFTYVAPPPGAPTVTAINPTSGSVNGGTSVTLTGTDFVSGATVAIGGVSCGSVNVASATSITCTTGAKLKGVASVVVTNPDFQVGSLSNGYTYTGAAPYTLLKNAVFGPSCSSCHSGGAPSGNMQILVYSSILSRITPNDGANSYLYQRVSLGQMPPTGGPLSATAIDSIKDWIDAGGANN
jgi:hypothetical protein